MVTALLTLALAAGPAEPHASFDTGATPSVETSNINGPISVTGIAGDKAEVDAVFSGPESGRAKWSVELKGEKGKLSAKVCCGPCGSMFHGSCDDAGQVALSLRVPAGSSVEASEVSGGLSIEGVGGAVAVHQVSGAAEVRGSRGPVAIHTVSGNVRLEPASVGPTALHSVSGNLEVKLPANGGASVALHTVSGRLNGESVGIGSAKVKVGEGSQEIAANTVSGNLDVHR